MSMCLSIMWVDCAQAKQHKKFYSHRPKAYLISSDGNKITPVGYGFRCSSSVEVHPSKTRFDQYISDPSTLMVPASRKIRSWAFQVRPTPNLSLGFETLLQSEQNSVFPFFSLKKALKRWKSATKFWFEQISCGLIAVPSSDNLMVKTFSGFDNFSIKKSPVFLTYPTRKSRLFSKWHYGYDIVQPVHLPSSIN